MRFFRPLLGKYCLESKISRSTYNEYDCNFYNMNVVVCKDGHYGDNCKTPCGHCLNNEACDKKNGTCYHGCINHFKEPKCAGKWFMTICLFSISL